MTDFSAKRRSRTRRRSLERPHALDRTRHHLALSPDRLQGLTIGSPEHRRRLACALSLPNAACAGNEAARPLPLTVCGRLFVHRGLLTFCWTLFAHTMGGHVVVRRPPVHCASHSLPRLPSARFPCGTVPRSSECNSGVVPGLCKRECYHMAQVRGRCYCYCTLRPCSCPAAAADGEEWKHALPPERTH